MSACKEAAIDICGKLSTDGKMSCPEYCQVMDAICEFDTLEERDGELEALWDKFGDVPMNPDTEKMEEPFIHFPAGTDREDIWHWFDDRKEVPNLGCNTWGYVEYEAPLEWEQIYNYELQEAGPFYMNRETGELLSLQMMLKQFSEEYDGDDPTNGVGWNEYYEEVG